ncbi:uncharacterized protein METZ01_LOCUS55714 [marine metagenome]|uniref:Uncharacterized protein n=1 Tax=marine metagenome TaxID=408172 RepID=A0A381SFJ5_9ZZZZ
MNDQIYLALSHELCNNGKTGRLLFLLLLEALFPKNKNRGFPAHGNDHPNF